jgi:hypothetical protein
MCTHCNGTGQIVLVSTGNGIADRPATPDDKATWPCPRCQNGG